jgi:hypothetical protein
MRTHLAAVSLALVVSVFFLCPQAQAQPGPVVINEILYDPTGPDSLAEWVELTNTSPVAPVSLAGWFLTNAMQTQILPLPGVVLPPEALLVVRFEPGPNAFDFTDGDGVYCTGTSAPVFGNALDAAALYWSMPPGPGTLADYVAWSAVGVPPSGPSAVDASSSGQWPPGSFVDVSFLGPHFVAPWTEGPGETIGRNGLSTDSNGPADWSDHGGIEALAETEGARNTGPFYRGEDLIYLAQAGINQFLWEFALNTEGASHTVVTMTESEFDVQVSATHAFQVRSRTDGTTGTLAGNIDCHWQRLPGSVWRLDMSGQLFSTRGLESLQFTAAVVDSGALVGTAAGASRNASLFYTTPMGYPVNLDLAFTQRWSWIDPTTLHLVDTRSMTDSRGVSLVRASQRDQWFPDDASEEVSLSAVTTFTQPPFAPTEYFQESSSKTILASGTLRGVMDVYRIETEGRSISLLGPSPFEWTRVTSDSLQFNQAMTLGSPELGYATGTIHGACGAVVDPATHEFLVRGGTEVLFPGGPPRSLTYYVDKWDWPWKTTARVLNGGGWAGMCATGVLIGSPTVIVAVGSAVLCGAGGILGDVLIEKKCPPDKGGSLLRQDIPPPLIHFPRRICVANTVPDPAPPTALLLGPGRPNPFGEVTSLSYEMPGPGRARLIVCDAGGRLVRNLVDRVREGGRHEAVWDGRDDQGVQVSSGTYFVRLTTPYGARRVAVVRAPSGE